MKSSHFSSVFRQEWAGIVGFVLGRVTAKKKMIIDKLAYNSKLRNIAPISKLLFSMSVLVICIWANSFLVSVFTALTMLFLIIL